MAPPLVVRILDGRINIRRRMRQQIFRQTKKKRVSHHMAVYATSTGAGSKGRATIDSAAPVLLGAGAISGSGICMSS